jgi:ADP-ribosylglycohydrolase
LLGYSRGRFPIGQYSDDSQLARELVRSFVERRQFDPADYAARIAALFTEERIVGRGRATEEAAYRIARGVPWQDAGTPAPAAGNGSAMRAAPIGLFFCDDPEALIASAHDQGRITHQDPRCSAGAIAIAGAAAVSSKSEQFTPAQVFDAVPVDSPTSIPCSPSVAGPPLVQLPPHRAIETISSTGVRTVVH